MRFMDEIKTVRQGLTERMTAEHVKALGRLAGARGLTRKAEIAEHIDRYLSGQSLREVLNSLDDSQRAAVAEVVHSPGRCFDAERFAAKYGTQPAWGSLSYSAGDSKPSPLRFFLYGRDLQMPADLKARLVEIVPPPRAANLRTETSVPESVPVRSPLGSGDDADTVPVEVCRTERNALAEVMSVLRLIDAGKVDVREKSSTPTSGSQRTVETILEGGDFYTAMRDADRRIDRNAGLIRAFAWPMIVQEGGLAKRVGRELKLTKDGHAALTTLPAIVISSLWESWVYGSIFDELSRIECVKGQTGKGKRGLTLVDERREAVSEALADCPVDQWIAVEEFLRFVRASGREIRVTERPEWLYLVESGYGSLGYEESVRILDDRWVMCLLLEYAATLGLIDVAIVPPAGARNDFYSLWGTDELAFFSRYDGLLYFRLNALGAFVLDRTDRYEEPRAVGRRLLRVLPNLEIAAIDESLTTADRLALDSFFVQVSSHVWRIERDTLLSVVEGGRTVDQVRQFLLERTDGPLPDTVATLLGDTEERCSQIRGVGPALLLECSNRALALLIANDRQAGKHCLVAGERHLVVPEKGKARFSRAIRKLGYLIAPGLRVAAETDK